MADTPSNVPIPDPSLLTTEQSDRLREEMQREIAHLKELVFEKFTAVGERFTERDVRSEREARDNKTAVDAAFAAQKEAAAAQNAANTTAIGKSEDATKEALVKLGEAGEASRQALSDRIDAVKESVSNVERTLSIRISDATTAASNLGANRQGGQQATALMITLGLLLLAVVGLVLTH